LLLEKLDLEFDAELKALDDQVTDMHYAKAGLPTQDEMEFRYGTGEWAGLRGKVNAAG